MTGKASFPHIGSLFCFVSYVILKTGVARLSFWATEEEGEGGKDKSIVLRKRKTGD